MENKMVIVTGANSGIGKITAMSLAQKDYHVVMVCRNAEKGKAAQQEIIATSNNKKVDLLLCDFSSLKQVRKLADTILASYEKINVLVNNAGMIAKQHSLTEEHYESTFAINHLAPFLLTNLLLERIKATPNARIVTVASDAHKMTKAFDFGNLQAEKSFKQWEAYGLSKLCNIYFTYELAKRLENTGVTANCLHPGVVRTNFGNEASKMIKIFMKLLGGFLLTPEKGAETSIFLASDDSVKDVNGKYFIKKRQALSSELSYNEDIARKLWEHSEKLVGLS